MNYSKNKSLEIGLIATASLLFLSGCRSAHGDLRGESPPPSTMVADKNMNQNTAQPITATIRLDEKVTAQVDQYAAFIDAPADEVFNYALD